MSNYYAIIALGGKQYVVIPGTRLKVAKLPYGIGEIFSLQPSFIKDPATEETHIGNPLVQGATVTIRHEGHSKAKKVIIFKKKRRHNYRRKKGHRQEQSELTIQSITC